MAKKPKAPKKQVEEEIEEEPGGEGFPEHGDPLEEDEPPGQSDPGDEDDPKPPVVDPAVAELKTKIEAQQRELDNLKRATPPPTPKEPTIKKENEIDWEKLLFENPAEYTRLMQETTEKRVETKLRGEYQRDKSTTAFWDKFYSANKDLKVDHDLVEVTLNANLSELANIPVDQAIEKLADLTRTRILRYAGDQPRGKKARAEGSNPPSPPRAPTEPTEVTSLSDIIKRRRAKRASAA